jgi:hypothetical protein
MASDGNGEVDGLDISRESSGKTVKIFVMVDGQEFCPPTC